MKITDNVRQALTILEKHGELRARQFSLFMWPNHPSHEKQSNIGYGATKGVGMWFAAEGYLAKLKKMGLVQRGFTDPYSYCLTPKGRKIINKEIG